MEKGLDRFITAQEKSYAIALREIRNGKKITHWIWYIFPQIAGLGHSENSKFYAIHNLSEASDYLEHLLLGPRLIEISQALVDLKTNNATQVMGNPDDVKLQSCMTLFSKVEGADPIFQTVLEKYFGGIADPNTISRLRIP